MVNLNEWFNLRRRANRRTVTGRVEAGLSRRLPHLTGNNQTAALPKGGEMLFGGEMTAFGGFTGVGLLTAVTFLLACGAGLARSRAHRPCMAVSAGRAKGRLWR